MSATKILWGQIVVVSVIVLAAIWGATQWTVLAAWLPAPARDSVDRDRGHAGLSSTGVLSLVVLVRRLCAQNLCRGRDHRFVRRLCGDCDRNRHVGVARARGQGGDHLWLRALGERA